MNKTTYILVHRITRKELAIGQTFNNMIAAALFALVHDLHADVVPL